VAEIIDLREFHRDNPASQFRVSDPTYCGLSLSGMISAQISIMAQTPHSKHRTADELLEQGRFALQAIRYREQIARYQAEASQLQAAILLAEHGDPNALELWLKRNAEGLELLECHYDLDRNSRDSIHSSTSQRSALKEPMAGHRSDPAQPLLGPHTPIASRWAKMEQAAMSRLKQRRAASEPALQADDSLDLLSNELTAMPDPFPSIDQHTSSDSSDHKRWWVAPHIVVSAAIHLIAVFALSFVLLSAVMKPEKLAIVAATIESEEVLMELPMEMVGELDNLETDLNTESVEPSLSELHSEFLPASIAREEVVSSANSPTVSSIVESSSSASAMVMGDKMGSGVEFFGVKATGSNFFYLVDNSPSMRRDGAFDAAKQELIRSLASMKSKQRYYISFFGKEIESMQHGAEEAEKYAVYAIPENLSKTIEWLGKVLVQKDGWPPNDALAKAIEMQPDAIFLLFDGDTKVDVAKFLRTKNRSDDFLSVGSPKVPIHVVHFFNGEFQKQMKQISDENGGTYRFVPRPNGSSKRLR
jgi:hypothetical protein